MHVEPLGLKNGEAVGHREQLLAHLGEIVQAFFKPKSARLLEQASLRR